VTAAEIDDPTAAKQAADAPGHLPGFIQLLPRQTPRMTHGARQPMEQRATREPVEIVIRQPTAGRG
jgi:hypothetical protein